MKNLARYYRAVKEGTMNTGELYKRHMMNEFILNFVPVDDRK